MTSPGGSEHVSRYKAVGEFDSLVRAAQAAKRALKELREEEAKLNAQSLEDDKKLAASKEARAKAELKNIEAAKKATADLNKNNSAAKSGEDAGVQYTRGIGKGVEKEAGASNRQWLDAATKALGSAFANAGNDAGKTYTRNLQAGIKKESESITQSDYFEKTVKNLQETFKKAGDESGRQFLVSARQRFRRDSSGVLKESGFEYSLREYVDRASRYGEDTGTSYTLGIAKTLKRFNANLSVLGFDKLDLDVSTEDALQSIAAIEFELKDLANKTDLPQVRIDANRALRDLRDIQKVFKDEVSEEVIKESARIRKELEKIDALPSGKAFKFWALTALSDMSRVFEEAEKGTSVFERLRRAMAASDGGGGGGNFLRSFISGFDDFSESSSRLLQRLSRVSGEIYRMPGLIATLIAAIPALVAGLGALGGGALGLASGLGAALGVIAAFPAATIALGSSIGAVSGIFGQFAEVLKNAQKARQEEAEAQEKQRLGTEKALTAQQKLQVALESMPEATEKVTSAVIDFSEAWGQARANISESFFKEVAGDTENLSTLLPILENLLGKAASAIGRVTSAGIRMITSGPWSADFGVIAEDNAAFIENMGFAGLSVAEAFKDIAVAAGPFSTWLTEAIREGADAFADWASNARSDGTISAFLAETRESLQSLWQILKNLGNVVNSFFQSTVDEGQRYLRTLEDITGHWADVAKAQEAANSPLREWMQDIRPVLSALGGLIGDFGRRLAALASDSNSITQIIRLLNTLRTEVLPPIFDILQSLNDSGIAVSVVQALGDMLQAISVFLQSGAATALSVFVTILATFFELLFNIASLPGISHVLGAVASGIAALAAVSIVARFTGLFKIWDFFTWMTRNRGNLSGAFSDAARGVAGLQTRGEAALPNNIPSSIGTVGSEALGNQARVQERVGTTAASSAQKVGIFSSAVSGLNRASSTARNALSSLGGFLGGPWGIALTVATVGVGLLAEKLVSQKRDAEATRSAFLSLKDAYKDLQGGDTSGIQSLAETDEKLKAIIDSSAKYKVNLTDLSGALGGQDQALNRVNTQLDAQIALLKNKALENPLSNYGNIGKLNSDLNANAIATQKALAGAVDFKNQINEVANAQSGSNKILNEATNYTRSYQERLGGLTQAQVDNVVQIGELDTKIRLLSGALDTMASATSTNSDRAKALGDIINYEKGSMESANEAAENWNSTLLTLTETAEANGKSLSKKTREGLRNRDALQAAAKATRDLYLEDIASGTPMDAALKRHKDRIAELEKEAIKTFNNKNKVKELIDVYGDIPDFIKTDIQTDEKGFSSVFVELSKLQVMQKALMEGKSLSQAQEDWNKESGKFYQRYIPNKTGDGPGIPGYATGGPVWGSGTKTSDSIRAWLSNGEFVQPADAVDHYGMNIMEAIRTKRLSKESVQEALPSESNATFSTGGPAHSDNCISCSSGGHKFATGGQVRVPIHVNPENTKIDKDWVYSAGSGAEGIGNQPGAKGVSWMMGVLRKQFPGLPLWSGLRPGSRTLSGNLSYHALGRAVDLPPRRDVAQWIRANYGARTKELITPYNDLNLWNGKPHRYTGAVWNQHNFAGGNAHDHWAFNQGGLVDLMSMLNMDNLAPKNNPLPSTPRSLSPAASSVVNNSTDNTRTFGDVIINNPLPERAGDSVRDSLYRTTLLY